MKKIAVLIAALRLFGSLFIATLILFSIIESDQWVIQRVEKAIIETIEKEYKTKFSCTLAYISIFQGRIVLWDVHATNTQDTPFWEWFSSEMEIHFSYSNFLSMRKISCSFYVPFLYCYSTAIDNAVAIGEHVKQLRGPPLPSSLLRLARIVVQKFHVDIAEEGQKKFLSTDGSFYSRYKSTWGSSTITAQNCMYCNNGTLVVQNGSCMVEKIYDDKKNDTKHTFHGQCDACLLNKKHRCAASGDYVNGLLQTNFSVDDYCVSGRAHSSQPYGTILINGDIDGAYIKSIMCALIYNKPLEYTRSDKKIAYQGTLAPDFSTLSCAFQSGKSYLQGKIDCMPAKGSFDWYVDSDCTGIALMQSCEGSAHILKNSGEWEASTNFIAALHGFRNKLYDLSVHALYKNGMLSVDAHDNQSRCVKGVYNVNKRSVESCIYTKNDKKQITHIVDAQERATGTIYPSAIEELAALGGVHVWCEQPLHYEGYFSTQSAVFDVTGSQISIYGTSVPLYINALKAHIDANVSDRVCKIYNAHVGVNQGSADCAYGVISFSNATFKSSLPICFSQIHVMPYHDVYGVISGAILYSCGMCSYGRNIGNTKISVDQPIISGYCLFDQVYIRANIFSDQFHQQLRKMQFAPHKTCAIDLVWSCRNPIMVKTDLLAISFLSSGKATGTMVQPFLSGSISVVEGKFNFPYKPLFISFGDIVFEQSSSETFAESANLHFVARNVIKSYDVTLGIRGTLAQPHIELSSYPVLLENQIITLLYGGSDEGSIYCMVPQTLVKSLSSMVLGSREESSKTYEFVQHMLKPFQHVRVIPRLSNKSARGGIKGALSVEIDDRLRATVEKNFDLSEEAAIDIEYDLSDDTILKCARDERGEYGIEIGSRWHS
jgi:hypothetical protein